MRLAADHADERPDERAIRFGRQTTRRWNDGAALGRLSAARIKASGDLERLGRIVESAFRKRPASHATGRFADDARLVRRARGAAVEPFVTGIGAGAEIGACQDRVADEAVRIRRPRRAEIGMDLGPGAVELA